jgi:hypothetical protein
MKLNSRGGLIVFLSNYCIYMMDRLLETPDERMVIPKLLVSGERTESRGVILRVISTSAFLSGHCVRRNFLDRLGTSFESGIRVMPTTVICPFAAIEDRVNELFVMVELLAACLVPVGQC